MIFAVNAEPLFLTDIPIQRSVGIVVDRHDSMRLNSLGV